MLESFCCWRSLRLPGFFHSANRAPLRSLASCWLAARLASFQISRRISSKASVAALTICNGSSAITALGQRSETGRVIHSASSHDTKFDLLGALFPQQIQELLDRLAVPAVRRPDQPAGVMIDDHGQVFLPFADRDLIEPQRLQACEQVTSRLGLRAHALADTPDGPPRDPHQHADRGL